MWSIRRVLIDDDRRIKPWTSYPLSNKSSARYEPSWPVTPVISARGCEVIRTDLSETQIRERCACVLGWHNSKAGLRQPDHLILSQLAVDPINVSVWTVPNDAHGIADSTRLLLPVDFVRESIVAGQRSVVFEYR